LLHAPPVQRIAGEIEYWQFVSLALMLESAIGYNARKGGVSMSWHFSALDKHSGANTRSVLENLGAASIGYNASETNAEHWLRPRGCRVLELCSSMAINFIKAKETNRLRFVARLAQISQVKKKRRGGESHCPGWLNPGILNSRGETPPVFETGAIPGLATSATNCE